MANPEAAVTQYRRQQQIAIITAARVRRLWMLVGDDFDSGWADVRGRTIDALQLGRAASVNAATDYTSKVLAETRQAGAPAGAIIPAAFLDAEPNGMRVGTTLDAAPTIAKTAVARGATAADAVGQVSRWITGVALTMLADTRRDVFQADMIARPRVTGYVRMLNPPSCNRCVILAGKRYLWNAGFQRHPRCFPAGVVVSGPEAVGATRRWFEGELVILTTASGQELPVTGNHPILTRRGWVPANLIEEGDEVVRSTRPEGAAALVVPDHDQVPARIEDVWGALGMAGLDRVESSPEDFHGDGQHGYVDVVRADRSFDGRRLATLDEFVEDELLSGAAGASLAFDGEGAAELLDVAEATLAGAAMRGLGLGSSLLVGQTGVADLASLAHAAALHARFHEDASDGSAGDAVLAGESVFGGSVEVGLDNLLGGELPLAPRWDAPGDSFTVETAAGYSSVGRDLLDRLAGQVELDRVVEVRRTQWSGHVYSLNSSEGWHVANSLIVSNCDCIHIPASEAAAGDLTVDPYAYFRSLSDAEQNRVFGDVEARAIRDGGDIYRVVNLGRSGLGTAAGNRVYGTPFKRTLEDIYRRDPDRKFVVANLQYHGWITGPQTAGGNILGNDPLGRIVAGGRGRGTYTVGGQVVTTARAARYDAAMSGVRDPLNRATMTAAERNLYDAYYRNAWAQAGYRPNSIGANSADRGLGLRAVTARERAEAEEALRLQLALLKGDPVLGRLPAPESVQELARILGF